MKEANDTMSRLPIEDIIQYIARSVTQGRTVLVGIDGGAGAGKTTFAKWLAERIEEEVAPVSTVLTDRMYRPVGGRWKGPIADMPIGYDVDWERIRDEVLLPLRAGKTARFQLYDWIEDCLNEWVEIDSTGVTIIDGVCALRNELSEHYDLRIWVSCPLESRITRLLNRGTSQEEIDSWLPIEERYHAVHEPEKSAHLAIDSAGSMSADDEASCLRVIWWSPPCSTR